MTTCLLPISHTRGSRLEIISDVSHGNPWPRIRHQLLWLLGNLLIIVGLTLTAALLTWVLLLIVNMRNFVGLTTPETVLLLTMSLSAITCLFAGFRLRRGTRRLILFLRRFGFVEASSALTFAVQTALGARWRLVTLDDAEIAPVGVSKVIRRTWGVSRWLTVASCLIGSGLAVYWLVVEKTGNYIYESTYFGGPFELLDLLNVLIPVAIAGTLTIVAWNTWREIREADSSKALRVETGSQIGKAVDRIVKLTRGVFAPRLVVMRSANAVWQQVVQSLVEVADVVLIDISIPTQNLLWEIANLKSAGEVRRILVGRRIQIETMEQQIPTSSGLTGSLLQLLEGEKVLVYEGDHQSGMKRFARAFHWQLETETSEIHGRRTA